MHHTCQRGEKKEEKKEKTLISYKPLAGLVQDTGIGFYKSVLHKLYTLHNLIYRRRTSPSLFNSAQTAAHNKDQQNEYLVEQHCQRWVRCHNRQSRIQNNTPAIRNLWGKRTHKTNKITQGIDPPRQRSGKPTLLLNKRCQTSH